MRDYEPFSFADQSELLSKAEELGVELPYQDSVTDLLEPVLIKGHTVPNRLAVHPMEGFDGNDDGSPGELTFRRYRRYAEGGSGLIWFEATSVVPAGRSNPRQLMLSKANIDAFKKLVAQTREQALEAFGPKHNPFLVLQLTHSGRLSRPEGVPAPVIASSSPYLKRLEEDAYILSDDELESLKEEFIEAAGLASEIGFDAVDIKACHGYLIHELLYSFTRENSRFGGESLENRARFLLEIIDAVRAQYAGIQTAVRLSLCDLVSHPFGFGVAKDGTESVDLHEALELIHKLVEKGCLLINATAGIPFYNPHVGRPADRTIPGSKKPPEHQLEGISRLIGAAGEVQRELEDAVVVGTGYTWLRHFFPNVGAAVVAREEVSIVGLGRSSFAYPDAPRDLMTKGRLDPEKVCITCSGCTELMRHGRVSGCIFRDREIYAKEYRKILR